MPRRRREHHDPLRRVDAGRFPQPLDGIDAERAIDQHGMPGALRQKRAGDVRVRDQAGLAAPALQPPRDQGGLDGLRSDQHDRLATEVGSVEGWVYML